jgi:hypothetical protein
MHNWISTTQSLPKEGDRVLVHTTTGYQEIMQRFQCSEHSWIWVDNEHLETDPEDVTHWQPLPAPPT